MYEYEICNEKNNEHNFIWGYNAKNAFSRHSDLDPNEWKIIAYEYID